MDIAKYTRKLIGNLLLVPLTRYYLSKERKINIGNIRLKIPSGVFHPTLFFSTKFLLHYLGTQNVSQLKILELGAGSGLLSIAMAKQGAIVTASDIVDLACTTVHTNASINDVSVEVIQSDLFNKFSARTFDLVLINPPYYPLTPKTDTEKAWYCGTHFDYYYSLFNQLSSFLANSSYALIVLSDDCDIEKISQIALQRGYLWKEVCSEKFYGEWNYIFKVSKDIYFKNNLYANQFLT